MTGLRPDFGPGPQWPNPPQSAVFGPGEPPDPRLRTALRLPPLGSQEPPDPRQRTAMKLPPFGAGNAAAEVPYAQVSGSGGAGVLTPAQIVIGATRGPSRLPILLGMAALVGIYLYRRRS